LKCPNGYPRLAAILDSDQNFLLYRQFGYLQSRLLLYKQDELSELESKLDDLDEAVANEDPALNFSLRKQGARIGERIKLLQQTELKFKEYCTFFMKLCQCLCKL
jgi:hypothetical protein